MLSLPGPAVLNIGAPGSGKTRALCTILQTPLSLFVLGTETRFAETLLDTCSLLKLDTSRLHIHLVEPLRAPIDALIEHANKVLSLSFEDLSKLKAGIRKADYGQWLSVLHTIANFKCDLCGESFGSVTSWETDRAFAIDSLSGLNMMAMDLTVGSKPVRAQGEWGVAMSTLERLIATLCSDTRCLFTLTAHLERERDEVLGVTTIQAATLGQRLSPIFPRHFSEVVLSVRDGMKFYWSTATPNTALKARALEFSTTIDPSYIPIIAGWHRRLGAYTQKGEA